MVIFISIDEFEDKVKNAFNFAHINNVSIDYATNAIHASFTGHDDVIIFKFDDYGFFNQNKYNTYSLSYGEAGITILLKSTKVNN